MTPDNQFVQLSLLFATSFTVTLSGAMMPGPLFTAAISGGIRRGASAGPLLMLGHAALESVLLVGLFLGLAPLLTSKEAFVAIALSGSLILIWMSLSMLRSAPTLSLALEPERRGGDRLVLSGVLLSVFNPYWSIWWATIGLGYVLQSRERGWLGVIVFFAGHLAADFGWYSAVTLAVARGKRLLSDTVYRRVVSVCAVALAVFASIFGWTGIERLMS
ncbi:MAG: LysE family transporter [Desulfocurvibacter africanus]